MSKTPALLSSGVLPSTEACLQHASVVPPDAKLKQAVRAAPCGSMPVQRVMEHANAKKDGTDDFRIAPTTIAQLTDVLAQPRNAV